MEHEDIIFVEERREKIKEYINSRKKATVIELSEYFNVSIATIRNDLRELELLGLLTRTHGGALKKSKASQELMLEFRNDNIVAKRNMAKKALSLIDDGDTLILDSGTTIHELAKLLNTKNDLTIITNDITCASIVEPFGFNIVILGGILTNGFHWTTGEYTSKILKELSADKVFLSAGGFSIEKGISVGTLPLAYIKELMIKCSAQSILLCDNSKFEKYRLVKFADFNDIDIFIADVLNENIKNIIEESGGEFIVI